MDFQRVDLDYLRRRALLKWGRWPEGIISLSVADIDYPPPPEIKEAVAQWLSQDRTPYGHYQGEPELRQLLAEKVSKENGIPATAEDIVVVPGTMFAIFLVCYLFLKPGDQALLSPSPVYGPFWKNVEATGAQAVGHELAMTHGFCFRRDTLAALVNSKTKLIMVCNPHNPTGRVLERGDLEAIAQAAMDRDVLIFSDELYEDMIFEGKHISIASLSPEISSRTITVFGFSKAFGVPGYRVAYMVVPGRLGSRVLEATRRIIVHADSLAQAAALGCLRARSRWVPALLNHLKQMRDLALDRLAEIKGIDCQRPQATPFLFPQIAGLGMSSEETARFLLEEAGVVVQPGRQFGQAGEGFIRLNIATSWEVLQEALERIQKAVSQLRP